MGATMTDDFRDKIIQEQEDSSPKQRGRTYYYPDGLGETTGMWIKHNPGCNIPIRIEKITPRHDNRRKYDSHLQMNIGSEQNAYRLYCALKSYFEDERAVPWFLESYDEVDK